MESILITLAVIALAAISNWLQHRAQSQDEAQHPPPPRPKGSPPPPVRTPPPRTESTLERELRRLLGEELPPVPPFPKPPSHKGIPPTSKPAPHAPPRIPPATPVPSRPLPVETPAPLPSAAIAKVQSGFERAQNLSQTVADRLKRVDEQTEKHGARRVVGRSAAPQVMGRVPAAALLRSPEGLRQAIVVSLILGPPKAEQDLS